MDDSWILTVEFDDLETQYKMDPELYFPNDEASKLVRILGECWSGILPEELQDYVDWTSTKVVAKAEVLDQLMKPLEELLWHSVPRSITITRNYERD